MIIGTVIAALLLTILGTLYVKGYDIVKARSPEHLPHFYLIMATVRMLLALTAVGIYVLLNENRDTTIPFAITFIIMYVIMMVVTLKLRH